MAEVVALEYAVTSLGFHPAARRPLRGMLWLAILSGLCVGAAFFALTGTILSSAVHVGVFTATILIAFRTGAEMHEIIPRSEEPNAAVRMTLDLLALIGLIILGLAPIAYHLIEPFQHSSSNKAGAMILGFAYALLAGSTTRHLFLYRALANVCWQFNRRKTARSLVILGWFKTIYEALWLGSCAAALLLVGTSTSEDSALYLAFAALFGSMGFAIVWIWMIIAHAMLLRLARKQR